MTASIAFRYDAIAHAIAFARAHPHRTPAPDAVADALGLDLGQWRQVLAEWAGITPERFLHCLGREYAHERLALTPELLPELQGGGAERTEHSRPLTWEAMTPAAIRAAAQGIELGHGLATTPFGDALLAWSARGLCHLAFRSTDEAALLAELHQLWPTATLVRDDAHARSLAQRIFPSRSPSTSATAAALPSGKINEADSDRGGVHLLLRGTPFQVRVWSALMRIPRGRLLSYRQLATLLGMPAAPRSVGSAIAANTLGYLVPCHRLIRAARTATRASSAGAASASWRCWPGRRRERARGETKRPGRNSVNTRHSPDYLAGYPPALVHQVRTLIEQGRLADALRRRYPQAHAVRSDSALHDYVQALKAAHLRSAPPLSKVRFDNTLHVIRNALGTHTAISRVQGSRLQAKREIRIATLFRAAPEAFLRMIVVHELAHLRVREHDKAFYQLCLHMEPDYHQYEFDLRTYLTYRDAGGEVLWEA